MKLGEGGTFYERGGSFFTIGVVTEVGPKFDFHLHEYTSGFNTPMKGKLRYFSA